MAASGTPTLLLVLPSSLCWYLNHDCHSDFTSMDDTIQGKGNGSPYDSLLSQEAVLTCNFQLHLICQINSPAPTWTNFYYNISVLIGSDREPWTYHWQGAWDCCDEAWHSGAAPGVGVSHPSTQLLHRGAR